MRVKTPSTFSATLFVLLAAGCSGGGPGDAETEPPVAETESTSAEPESPSAEPAPPSAEPAPPSLEPAPWARAPLPAAAVPRPFRDQWSSADNRESCALLAPDGVVPRQAEARGAHFGGGWGVAYDLPDQRSAFGVAGTGVSPSPDLYDEWPHRMEWAEGSHAGYGPEGGSGPKQLAYLVIPGQECLYNVWSMLGRRHLEELLRSLRYVAEGSR